MTDYRTELQAFVDAAASFTEPALGHHKAWADAVARARVALSVPESSANTVCPITPPPELVQQWFLGAKAMPVDQWVTDVATQAARWGSDQELEACCEWLEDHDCEDPQEAAKRLRAVRRPKPPRLKEQALSLVPESGGIAMKRTYSPDELAVIRRALEQLDD